MFEKLGNLIIKIHNFNLFEYLQLSKHQEELIFKIISLIAFLMAIGLVIGLVSYIKRCMEDEEFY